jgi:hypothetical protein
MKTTKEIAGPLNEERAKHLPITEDASLFLENLDVPRRHVYGIGAGIAALVLVSHHLADRSGWWDEYNAMPEEYRKHFIAAKIALVHSEISEGLEGFRKNEMDQHLPHRRAIEVEFADAFIRMGDMAGALGLDIAGAIIEKLAYNQQRKDHTREHREAEGGKSL